MKNFFSAAILMVVFVLGGGVSANAGVTYKDGDKYLKIGGRIQFQYHVEDPDTGSAGDETTDNLFFRRFRPYIEGSVHEDWSGKFQWDMGKSGFAVCDAYFKYKGIDNLTITLGNACFPFSREQITSSKKQQLVEKTFVGDHNYGVPDNQTGLHLSGNFVDDKVDWGVSLAKAAVDPSNSKLDFDTVIQYDKGGDWLEGNMVGGRINIAPLGKVSYVQGDLKKDEAVKVAFGVGAFAWNNDEDGLDKTSLTGKEVEEITGVEVSAAVRGFGVSVDAQYNRFDSELYETGVTDGLYEDSETTMEIVAVEGGYMLLAQRLEAVAGYEELDADNYAETWTRTSVGLNYFFEKQDIKVQTTYRVSESVDGEKDNDNDEWFMQFQYVF